MKWWSKTQRLQVLLAISVLAALLGAITTGGISFPALSGVPFAEVPYFALTPLIACATLAATSNRADSPLLATATRRLAPGALALALIPVLAAALIDLAFIGETETSSWLPARITCGDIGVQLLVGVFLGTRYQALGPAAALFIAALFGRDGTSAARWAWPIDQRTDPISWVVPVALIVLGAAALLTLSNRCHPRGDSASTNEP